MGVVFGAGTMKQLKTESDKAMEVPLPEAEDVDSDTEVDDEEEEDTDAKIKLLLEENARLVEANTKSTEENKVSIRVKVEPFDCSIAAHSLFNDYLAALSTNIICCRFQGLLY